VRSETLALEVVFTTPIGLRDQVDLRIGARAGRDPAARAKRGTNGLARPFGGA